MTPWKTNSEIGFSNVSLEASTEHASKSKCQIALHLIAFRASICDLSMKRFFKYAVIASQHVHENTVIQVFI